MLMRLLYYLLTIKYKLLAQTRKYCEHLQNAVNDNNAAVIVRPLRNDGDESLISVRLHE